MTLQGEGRSEKELIKASNVYAQETPARSWWLFLSTLALTAVAITLAAQPQHWMLRTAASVVAGLLTVRLFIVYHDFQHGSILKGSKLAKWMLNTYGVLVLTPPNVWKQTHNYHHAHTAKIVGSHVGSYMMLNTDFWSKTTERQQLMYKIIRHPLTILCGYLTIFLYGMCVASFARNPRKNWDSAVAVALHVVLVTVLWRTFGFETMFFTLQLPLIVATASGAYLFYAQHNFPDAYIQPRETWSYARAALESSSYMKMGPVMNYFTGNIGYHHVHHLNYRIPFYRLPEAMAGIPELQHPRGVTSLHPRDIIACFQLKIWDAEAGRLTGYPEVLDSSSETATEASA